MNDRDVKEIQDWLETKRETTFRWGTRMLRGGQRYYNPAVLDRTGWENFYMTLPYDYDIRNDRKFNCHYSTYKRLGDQGFKWPETTTSEAMRTGACGPDKDSNSRPAYLRYITNDKRPEPAYRLHLADRTYLHYLSSDPLEGVLPWGRQGDMLKARSVSHRDFKWRRRCCPKPCEKPTVEREVHRFGKTDVQKLGYPGVLVDAVVKFDDEAMSDFANSKLMKLKKAFHWPINPITREPLGGRLRYYHPDECIKNRADIWPRGEYRIMDRDPIDIPEDRCEVLAHEAKEQKMENPCPLDPTSNYKAYLKTRFPRPNYECWEEVPDECQCQVPSECCFHSACTKDPPKQNFTCPPKPPCPPVPVYQ